MIKIHRNPNGDTRTAPKNVTYEQFQEANKQHIRHVNAVMWDISNLFTSAGERHDVTKELQERKFYNDFKYSIDNNIDFTKSEWYKMHVAAERHHLLNNCPEDVNFVDVIEMIADCVCAGLARSGEVRDFEINDEILKHAFKNTCELIKSMVILCDDEEQDD